MAGSNPQSVLCRQLLTNVADDETLSPWVDVRGYSYLAFYITATGTTSGGVISFEEMLPNPLGDANPPAAGLDTGNYSVIGTPTNASSVSASKQLAVRPTTGAYGFVRARISTAISGGGSISVGLLAQ